MKIKYRKLYLIFFKFFSKSYRKTEIPNAASNSENERHDLFISYEWGSKNEVVKFHKNLENHDIKVWRDSRLESNNKSLWSTNKKLLCVSIHAHKGIHKV